MPTARTPDPHSPPHHPPAPRTAGGPVPYRGLDAFRVEDAPWFFGREAETAAVLATLRRVSRRDGPRLAAVVGASGSGKSSLLTAGVIAHLTNLEEPDTDDVVPGLGCIVRMTPGEHPASELSARLDGVPDTGQVLLVVDQFEELFTACPDEAEREEFVRALERAGLTWATVLIGLRADFYRQAVAHPQLRVALETAQTVLGPLSRAQLRRAVVEPARLAGGDVDDGLVELLLREGGAGDPAILPKLSHLLLVMWQRATSGRLTAAGYAAAGGLHGAIAATAEAAYAQLTEPQREAARRLFLRLVAIGDGGPDAGRRVEVTGLEPGPGSPSAEDLHVTLGVFAGRRLLTVGDRGVELTHEVLLAAWPRLREWVDADRAGRWLAGQVSRAARAWESRDRDPSALLRGVRLDAAMQLAADRDHGDGRSDSERDFLRASLAERLTEGLARKRGEQRQALRWRVAAAAVAVTVAGTASLAGWSMHLVLLARHERDVAQSRQAAGRAERLRPTDPALAAQLALVAYRTAATPEARGALLDVSATPTPRRYPGPPGALQGVARSADGRVLVAGSESGTIRIWVTRPGGPPAVVDRPSPGRGPVSAVALTPDGRTLVTGGPTGVQLWDLTDPLAPALLPPPPGTPPAEVTGLLFEPGGTRLLAVTPGVLLRWDVADPRRPLPLPAPAAPAGAPLRTAAVSPDGTLLAVGSADGLTRVWRLTGGAASPPGTAPDTAGGPVTALAFSADGRSLAAGSTDGRTRLWTVAASPASAGPPGLVAAPGFVAPPGAGTGRGTGGVDAVAFSPDGARLATGTDDGLTWLWDVRSHRAVARFPHPGAVTAVSYGTDHEVLTAAADGAARVWPTRPPRLAVAGEHEAVAFSSNGNLLAAGAGANEAALVDVRDPEHPALTAPPLLGPGGAAALAGAAALTRDGRTLATGGRDGSVLLWDVSDPMHPAAVGAPFAADGPVVESMDFSPDGRLLAVGGDDGAVRLFDVTTPAGPRPLGLPLAGGGTVHAVAFSPDGQRLAAGTSGRTVLQWDLTHPDAPAPLGAPMTGAGSPVRDIAYSPDGRLVAAASADRTVWVWDVGEPGRSPLRARLDGAAAPLDAVAFAPDGRTLAAGGMDGAVRLWRLASSGEVEPVATLTAADAAVHGLAFGPDGRTLAAGTGTGVVLWRTSADAVAGSVCATAGAGLTSPERRDYLPGRGYRRGCGETGGAR